jgi:hypothetical protein
MADGMDKAFFLSTDPENVAYAYDVLWEASTQHAGKQDLAVGVMPLRTGGFAFVSKQGTDYQAWMLASNGDLRPLENHHVVRIIAHL